MAIVSIIRAGSDDLYDMNLYLASKGNNSDPSLPAEEVLVADRVATATDINGELAFNQRALQRYILHCGQNSEIGGLRGTYITAYVYLCLLYVYSIYVCR